MQTSWADKVAIVVMIIATVILISAIRLGLRLGGWA